MRARLKHLNVASLSPSGFLDVPPRGAPGSAPSGFELIAEDVASHDGSLSTFR
jgi:hypothetical protein